MSTLIKLLMGLSTAIALLGFIGAFAAYVILQFRIDHARVKQETGEQGWRIFGSVLAPSEFYKDDTKVIWRIQRISMKAFAISLCTVAVVMLGAAVLGISLE